MRIIRIIEVILAAIAMISLLDHNLLLMLPEKLTSGVIAVLVGSMLTSKEAVLENYKLGKRANFPFISAVRDDRERERKWARIIGIVALIFGLFQLIAFINA